MSSGRKIQLPEKQFFRLSCDNLFYNHDLDYGLMAILLNTSEASPEIYG